MSLESSDSEEKKVKVGFCWQLSDGRYLNGKDSDFVEQVLEDLQSFNRKGIRDSILIFPPFKNFHRFLIHNLVEENFKDLTTFSVGQSRERRTVVCHKDRVIKNRSTDEDRSTCGGVFSPMGIEQRTSESHEVNITSAYSGRKKARMLPDVALYQPPALRKASEGTSGAPPSNKNPKTSKQRRPDLAVYVPRALRGSSCPQKVVAVTPKDSRAERICLGGPRIELEGDHSNPPPEKPSSIQSPPAPLGPHLSSSPPTSRRPLPSEDKGENLAGGEETPLADVGGSPGSPIKRAIPQEPPVELLIGEADGAGASTREDHPPQLTTATIDIGGMATKGDASRAPSVGVTDCKRAALGGGGDVGDLCGGPGVGHWEDLLEVECHEEGGGGEEELHGELVDEVVAAVGKVSVMEKPKSDYGLYRTDDASLSLSELTHVVEVFGFPSEFKTHDLISILSPYGGSPGFEIKWVDDTHALAVFGSSFIAADVLNLRHPMLKTRAMEESSTASRAKARKICESLRVPYRPRPETCAALAQRLITGALGVRARQSKAEREEERRLLREAREKRRSAARERDAAWEGTIASTLL